MAEGGLAVAIAECCIAGGSEPGGGCRTGLTRSPRRPGGHSSSPVAEEDLAGLTIIGRVGGDTLELEGR